MHSWLRSSKTLISRSAAIGNPSLVRVSSNLICLSATISPLEVSFAFHTIPYVPSSSRAILSYELYTKRHPWRRGLCLRTAGFVIDCEWAFVSASAVHEPAVIVASGKDDVLVFFVSTPLPENEPAPPPSSSSDDESQRSLFLLDDIISGCSWYSVYR